MALAKTLLKAWAASKIVEHGVKAANRVKDEDDEKKVRERKKKSKWYRDSDEE